MTKSAIVGLLLEYLDPLCSIDRRLFIRATLFKVEEHTLSATLIDLFDSPDIEIQALAIRILLTTYPDKHLDKILAKLVSEHREIRGIICYELAVNVSVDSRVLVPLSKVAMNDSSPDVRYWAVIALANLGDKAALPTLEWVRNNDKDVNYEDERIADIAGNRIQWILEGIN